MAAKASAGSSGRSVSVAACRRSTSSTIASSSSFARPEVVKEHAVARADRFGDLAQRPPADPTAGERVDERVEQLRPAPLVRRARHLGVAAARCAP